MQHLQRQIPRPDIQSEASVSSSSLGLSSSQSSVEEPRARLLRGHSTEDDIPASRTEFEEELEMPSVRSLMSRFSANLSDDESSLKRVSVTFLKPFRSTLLLCVVPKYQSLCCRIMSASCFFVPKQRFLLLLL